jgi:hypothetical protein
MWSKDAQTAIVFEREDGSLSASGYLTRDDWVCPAIGTEEMVVGAVIRDLLEGYAGELEGVTIPVLGVAGTLLPQLLRQSMRSEEGAQLLYCSSGRVPPPQYLIYAGYLP